ncbi:heterotrimeric G protein alpha subunit [Lactarius deliciosus]|nr:heterotrimeric G protein alpha subunit [Lactarius deliciosus]
MIDHQIEDSRKYTRSCSGESGKSTIVKQMKIIHQNGYTPEELLPFRRQSLDQIQSRAYYPPTERIANVSSCQLATEDPHFFYSKQNEHLLYVNAILWLLFYCLDTHPFFAEAHWIAASNYLPSMEDVLRARAKTTAITETQFPLGQLSIHMVDVGEQRLEREKWTHNFESVTSIVFCTALLEYDQVLLEERNQNRMAESLVLFKSVIDSRWFLRTSIIHFLTKIDVFKNKLPKVRFPLTRGGRGVNKGAEYIFWQFM